jgi:ABC-type nitrate/sulfonate/bicarbonate transport system substrate-binding protein
VKIAKQLWVGLLIVGLTRPLLASAQESVVVSYDGYAGFQGPIWATKDLGLFEKYGLKSELVLIAGSARGMAALVSGSSHFAQGSASAPIPIRLRGGDIAIIAAALNRFPFSVVAQKEIRKPSDLVGKRIGILTSAARTTSPLLWP